MSAKKDKDFTDRLSTANSAKKALLEKFRAQPRPDDPAVIARDAERKAVAIAREQRAIERKAAQEAEAIRLATEKATREAEEAARSAAEKSEREEREAALEAEQKAKRDARYAARKARR